ncbi:DUF3829 domain-containing protein [Pseudomonas sp. KCJK8993]|uniref:DUF3829 domain-containing protein n=1 Tax=Pseudomonas sp. KCJK8993 TaxID=3344565 RepID=UPI003905BD88
MNPNWLFPIGLGLGLTLFGLAGSGKQLGQIGLWLDHRDSPYTAQANALSPIIDCMNQVDVPWRVAHQAYLAEGKPRSAAPGAYDLRSQGGQDIDLAYRSSCSGDIGAKLRSLDPDNPLLAATERYQQVLARFVALTKDAYMHRLGLGRTLDEAQLDELVRQLEIQAPDYLQASNAVRQLLQPQDVEHRPQQLQRLEQRLGRNVHWALLNYMIQARSTMDLLDDGLRQRTLTPAQLSQATQQLRQAWEARQQFIGSIQDPQTREALYLWQLIAAPSQHYLQALDTLHRDWLQHAEPQRLGEDFHAVTQGYDQMLYHYNQLARSRY